MKPFAWCPSCGKDTAGFYPSCGWCTSDIPLYVQANAVTQYLIGAPTFVEFRLLNASDKPLKLLSFEVRLGKDVLKTGVHPEPHGTLVLPGDSNGLLLDRQVDFGIGKLMPVHYVLDIFIGFSCDGVDFSMRGAHEVVFDWPGSRRIYVCDAETHEARVFENGTVPEGHAHQIDRFGEQAAPLPSTCYIASLKSSKGLRFTPLCMRYEGRAVPPQDEAAAEPICDHCGQVLVEVGAYCPGCGESLSLPLDICTSSQTKLAARCPHPHCGRGLADKHRYCPYCGGKIHLHLDINELSFYRQDTGTKAEFLLHSVHHHDITIRQFDVSLNDIPLKSKVHKFRPNQILKPDDKPLRTDWFVHPSSSGQGAFEVNIVYEIEGTTYSLTGGHKINILPATPTPSQIIYDMRMRIEQSGEGVHYVGPQMKQIDNHEKSLNTVQELQDYLEQVGKEQGFVYLPLSEVSVELLKAPARKPTIPTPDWPPSNRARFFFNDGRVTHNYCVLSTWRPDLKTYGPVRIGREEDWSDIRLREVERYEAERAKGISQNPSKDLQPSRVSRRHWEIGLLRDPKNPSLIQFTNLKDERIIKGQPIKKRHYAVIAPNQHLREGESCWRTPGESVILKADVGTNIIGLHYAANAPRFPKLTELQHAARAILERMPQKPAKLPQWPTEYGAYAFSRLFSLTGEPIPGLEDWKTLEAYVLMPGWATIGSSKNACIVMPDPQAAGIHAYIVHVDGYYFIAPRDETTPVYVGGEAVPPDSAWPLNPGTSKVRIGSTILTFDDFSQVLHG